MLIGTDKYVNVSIAIEKKLVILEHVQYKQ